MFKLTSACTATGIEELFKSIGCKFLDPNYKEDEEASGSNSNQASASSQQVKLDATKAKQETKKKGCC